jgi:hypothetical protein
MRNSPRGKTDDLGEMQLQNEISDQPEGSEHAGKRRKSISSMRSLKSLDTAQAAGTTTFGVLSKNDDTLADAQAYQFNTYDERAADNHSAALNNTCMNNEIIAPSSIPVSFGPQGQNAFHIKPELKPRLQEAEEVPQADRQEQIDMRYGQMKVSELYDQSNFERMVMQAGRKEVTKAMGGEYDQLLTDEMV